MWETVLSGNRWRGEIRNRKKDGTLYWESVLIAPVKNQEGKMTRFIAIKEDITSRKQVAEELRRTEEALRQRGAFLRTITEAAPLPFYVQDSRTDTILYFNQHFCSVWGLEELQEDLQLGKLKHSQLLPHLRARVADPAEFSKQCEPLADPEDRTVFDADIPLRDGRTLHHFSTQIRDEKDAFIGRLCLLEDITKRKQAEQQLAASLKQKEILLREVYHRVKNNLQVISSLLSLQSSAINDPQIVRLIGETQDRIRSMALVHEKLYRAKDLSRIDFDDYIRQLATMLARSYRTQSGSVSFEFEIEKLCFNLETAIPCGLVLNELVSNALKHAFPLTRNDSNPKLTIALRSIGNECFELIVCDNGVGLPAHLDVRNTASLGLQLVCMLTEQLRGELRVESTGGTKFTITFHQIKSSLTSEAQGGETIGAGQNHSMAQPR
jgi:PAS domain S-box-containing protein